MEKPIDFKKEGFKKEKQGKMIEWTTDNVCIAGNMAEKVGYNKALDYLKYFIKKKYK